MKASTKLKIIGFSMVAVGVTLIILGLVFSKDFAGGKMPMLAVLVPGIFIAFLAIPFLFMGFMPSIAKAGARLHNEALDSAGDEMSSAMNKSAHIASPAITTATKAVKDALNDLIYCRYCGKQIPADSVFCKYCGKGQE